MSIPAREFSFSREDHVYLLDGSPIPSLTFLLRPLYEPALSRIPDQELVERARERGVKTHKEIDDYNKGIADRYESPAVAAWASFCDDTGFKATHSEYSTYQPALLYGTTCDALGLMRSGKQLLVDVKTGNSHGRWMHLQTAGQVAALSSHGICPRDVLRANVYIKPKGEGYDYSIEMHENEGDFKALESYINWQRVRENYL